MKITISGIGGVGKGTVSKLLAEKMNYKVLSGGNFFRDMAKDLGMSLYEFDQFVKKNPDYDYKLDEKQVFILSDGIFSSNDEKEDEIVIEIDNHIVDFNEILNSELESINSDYHICEDCKTNDKFVEIEF